MLTAKQNEALTHIARAALDRVGKDAEFKSWTLTQISGMTFVVVETGRVDDEGTMAAVLCRHRGHFSIGKQGGIVSMEARYGKRGRKSNARKHPLIYGFTS